MTRSIECAIERRVWSNSASGYVRSVLRLFLGVISFRLLCEELSSEQLGFYGLAWSLLGCGVLFDLGMGVAVQKNTAELSIRKEWEALGRIISSVLFCNFVCGTLVSIAGFLVAEPLLRLVRVNPSDFDECRLALRIFFVGMGAMFPLEMFREVHFGQQRIAIVERLSTLGAIASFALLAIALRMKSSLPTILAIQVSCMIVTGIVITMSALRAMPKVRIGLQFVSWRVIRSIARFSTIAYVAALIGIVVLQMDRLVIGATLSVSSVAVYHIGAKVAEIFTAFTKQLPEALAPAAASMHGAGDRSKWQSLFLQGIRFNALVTTPLFCLCALFMESLLGLLTKGRANGYEVVLLGEVLVIWAYSTMLSHGVAKSVFLMSGQESRLVRVLAIEAIANLVCSIGLLNWWRTPIAAAVGSLVPAIVIGWGYFWRWIAREVGMSSQELAREAMLPAFRASAPLVVFGLVCRFIPALDSRSNVALLFVEAPIGVLIALAGTWHFALEQNERGIVLDKLAKYNLVGTLQR